MRVGCLHTLGVSLDHRGIRDPELRRNVIDHGPWHIERVSKKCPQKSCRPDLHGKTNPAVLTPTPADQMLIGVVEIEEPLQIVLRRFSHEPPERGGLVITQEFNWHKLQNTDSHVAECLNAQSCSITTQTPTSTIS